MFQLSRALVFFGLMSTHLFCFCISIEWLNDMPVREEALRIATYDARNVFLAAFTEVFKDIPLRSLHAASFESFLDKNYAGVLSRFKDDPDHCFFAVVTDEQAVVVGFAIFIVSTDRTKAFLRLIAVDPRFQRLGIGRALIDALFSRFPQILRLTLLTRVPNVQAQKFYEHLGFVRCPCTDVWAQAGPDIFVGYVLNR